MIPIAVLLAAQPGAAQPGAAQPGAAQPNPAQPDLASQLAGVFADTMVVRDDLDRLESSLSRIRLSQSYPLTPAYLRATLDPIVRRCGARVVDWRFGSQTSDGRFVAQPIELKVSAPHANPLACVPVALMNGERVAHIDGLRVDFEPSGARGAVRFTIYEGAPHTPHPPKTVEPGVDRLARARADLAWLSARRDAVKAEFDAITGLRAWQDDVGDGLSSALRQLAKAEPMRGAFELRGRDLHLSGAVRSPMPRPVAQLKTDGLTVEPFTAPTPPARRLAGVGNGHTLRVIGADAKRLRWVLQPTGRSMLATTEPGPSISATITGGDLDAVFAALEAAEPAVGAPLDLALKRGDINVHFDDIDAQKWARLSSSIDRRPTFAAAPGAPLLLTGRDVTWKALDARVRDHWGLEKARRDGLTWLVPAGHGAPNIPRGEGEPVEIHFTDASAADALRLLGLGGAACGGQRFTFGGAFTRERAAAIALHIGGVDRRETPAECPRSGPAAVIGTLTGVEPARAVYRDDAGEIRFVESTPPSISTDGPSPEAYMLEHGHPPPPVRQVFIDVSSVHISHGPDAISLDDRPVFEHEIERGDRLVATIEGPRPMAIFAGGDGRWFRVELRDGLHMAPTAVHVERGDPPFAWRDAFPLGPSKD